MAGNKIFYVTRTEDEATQTAGAATKTRADKPQLLKIVGVDHAGNPNPATPEDNQIYATEEEKQEILLTSDTVQAGDLNPVTSDAVCSYIQDQLELSAYEDITISTDSANPTVMPYDGVVYACIKGSPGYDVSIYIYVNNRKIACNSADEFGRAFDPSIFVSANVKKGDSVYLDKHIYGEYVPIILESSAAFYKKRDYSKRT